MNLKELVSNRISSEWKKLFNHNVRETKQEVDSIHTQQLATNQRISNLVLSVGGNSPTEVVDARVDHEGTAHPTLNDRLLSGEQGVARRMRELKLQLANQGASVEQINEVIQQLFSPSAATLNIYVSATRGDDRTGVGSEERPFQTIQMAVNTIPLLNLSSITIWVEDGVYLEDVRVANIHGSSLVIRTIQSQETLAPATHDLPVKVRSIGFFFCSGYFQILGIQIVDTANAPIFQGRRYGIVNEQGGYMAIASCKFGESTQQAAYNALYCGGASKMNVYGRTTFVNQALAIHSRLMAEVNVGDISGSGNTIGFRCDSATLRGTTPSGFASTATQTAGVGLIVTKGTVL